MRQREDINHIYEHNFLILFIRNSQIVPAYALLGAWMPYLKKRDS